MLSKNTVGRPQFLLENAKFMKYPCIHVSKARTSRLIMTRFIHHNEWHSPIPVNNKRENYALIFTVHFMDCLYNILAMNF